LFLTVCGTALSGAVGLFLLEVWRFTREEPYSRVEEGLYVGASVSAPPPGTAAVVNLCDREDPYAVDALLWEPILDGGKAPGLAWLRRVVAFIDAQRRAGVTTYVHCNAGASRSGMVVTAYLMYEHGWPRDRALKFARRKRPQIQPNPAFMRLLAEWEEALKDGAAPGRD
jgi:protein-tyrosine phosphatase